MTIYDQIRDVDQIRFNESVKSGHLEDRNDYHKNIILPTRNDVLNGRGKSTNAWHGNVFYRNLIKHHKLEYIVAAPEEQKLIAGRIISIVRGLNPSGRFLEMDKCSGAWCDIGDEKAIFKVRQALREGASGIREQYNPNPLGLPSQNEISEQECKQLLEMVRRYDM